MKALYIIMTLTAAAVFSSQFFQNKTTEVPEQKKSIPLVPKIEVSELFNFKLFSLEIEKLIKAREFKKALEYLKTNKTSLLDKHSNYIPNTTARINLHLAWTSYKSFGCDTSEALFISISESKTHYAKLANKGLALCLLKSKDFWEAKQKILFYIEAQDKDIEAYALLTKILDHTLEYETNLDYLISARKLNWSNTEKEKLDSLITKVKKKISISNKQNILSYGAFNISYNPDINNTTISSISSSLDSSLDTLVSKYGFEYPSSNIDINVYSSNNFKKMHNGPSWAGAVYDGKIRLPIDSSQKNISKKSLERVLRHELTHALLSNQSSSKRLPSWFNEGLAQYLECDGNCGSYINSISKTRFLEPQVLKNSFTKLDKTTASMAYSQSLHLLKVLTEIKGRGAIGHIVESISVTNASSDDLLAPVGITFDELYENAKQSWDG